MPLSLAEVLRDHWPRFARDHASRLAPAHYRAVRAVLACRTPALGGRLWQCACHANARHFSYHSCNHRSCPQCGALKDLCRSQLGGLPGFTSVLHTWGRQLQHHPHVHIVIPGIVLGPDGRERYPDKSDFLFHGTPLALRFRNRLELALKTDHPETHAALMRDHPEVFRVKWVADLRHTGSGKPALRYLARYVFKSALGPGRLLGYDKRGRIRLLCHVSGTNRRHVIVLSPDEFLRRWLTHVLPKGFVRVRHHGWMSGAARKLRLRVRALVCGELDEPPPPTIPMPIPRCELCGAEMKLIAKIEPRGPPRRP